MRRAIGVAVVLVLVAILSGCGQSPSAKEKAQAQKAERAERTRKIQEQRRALIAELAGAHRAVILDSGREMTWTSEVQDAFMPADGRPVAGTAGLTDIERDGKGFITRLAYGGLLQQPVVILLRCDPPADLPRRSSLIEHGDRMAAEFDPQYVFVAKIDSVKARRDAVTGETGPNVQRTGWTAEGKCLALRKMPVDETPRSGGARLGR
jgi:hypothetical protein